MLHSPARDILQHVFFSFAFEFTTTISKMNWIVRVCYELNQQLTKYERGGCTRSRLLHQTQEKAKHSSNWEDIHGQ